MAPPANESGFAARLTRKVGPLPVWAWATIILAVGYLVYRRRGSSSSSASQTTAVPVTPDVTGSQGGGGSVGSTGSDTGGGSQLQPAVDLSGITNQLDALSQQLADTSASAASGYDYGGPPGSTDTGPAASPSSPNPVHAYHPSYHAVSASTPNFAGAAKAQTKALGKAAPFGGVTSTSTKGGVTTTRYASGRVVGQAKGKTAYVEHR